MGPDAILSDSHWIVGCLRDRFRRAGRGTSSQGRPSVTLSYAQSLDGSIAAERGKPFKLSNLQSQILTHRLRAVHDAVLVGINTVLSDDPQLTVRLIPGRNPQPVVLDSRLRFPLAARLLSPPCVSPLIVTTADACTQCEGRLREAGSRVVRVGTVREGILDVRELLARLHELGIRSLMVEGGAGVITSFLAANVVDQLVVTIVPRMLGGLPAVTPFSGTMRSANRDRLSNVRYHSVAGDLVVFADLCGTRHDSEDGSSSDCASEFATAPAFPYAGSIRLSVRPA